VIRGVNEKYSSLDEPKCSNVRLLGQTRLAAAGTGPVLNFSQAACEYRQSLSAHCSAMLAPDAA